MDCQLHRMLTYRWLCFGVFVVSSFFIHGHAWSPEPPIYDVSRGDGVHKSLYPPNGVVQPLVGAEYQTVQNDKASTWIVEYYEQSCPHCWYFAAIYPVLAKALASPTVKFGAFNCIDPSNTVACQAASVTHYPTVLVYNAVPNQIVPHIVHVHSGNDLDNPLPAEDIADWLVNFSNNKIAIVAPQVFDSAPQFKGNKLVAIDGAPGRPGWTHEAIGTFQARLHDAHIGMARLLMDGYVSSTQYQAALNVVTFVGKIFSRDEQALFDSLLTSLKVKPALQPAEFNQIVRAWMTPLLTQQGQEYLFCTNKNCAVWQLFHAISVLIAIEYAPVTVAEALPAYRYMVDNFLSCAECKHHFVTSYDQCLFGRCEILTAATPDLQRKALVLWLWRLHNAVSVRVLKEHPPAQPVDRRYPAYRDCPGCWQTTVVQGQKAPLLSFAGQANNLQPVYDVFNTDGVYEFLKTEFLGEDSAKRLYQDSSFRQPSASSPVATFAISVCVAAVVTLLFVLFRLRRASPQHVDASLSEEDDSVME